MKLVNKKDISVCVCGMIVPPLATVEIADQTWKEEYARSKPLRDAVCRNFLEIASENASAKTEKKKEK